MVRVLIPILGMVCLWWWWASYADAEDMKYKDPRQHVAVRVKDLLSRMSLEEKIGQMVQIDRTVADPEVMKSYFIDSNTEVYIETLNTIKSLSYFVVESMLFGARGALVKILSLSPVLCSVLSGGGSVPLPKARAEDWINMINKLQKGDPDLVRRIGAATALEVRATGIPYVFAPCIAVCRDPRWGRCYESYSEDHRIVQEMTEIIPGLQGDAPFLRKRVPFVGGKKKVAACAKHFVGDGGTTKGINENNTVIDRHGLLSIHMPAYSDSIIKGVSTIMVSYSSWNGEKMHANRELVTGFLKDTLKFKSDDRCLYSVYATWIPVFHTTYNESLINCQGFVISDWEGIDRITSPPHSNYSYSIQAAIQAGIDMVMVPFNYTEFIGDLTNLVNNSIIPMDRIDDAVARILLVKFSMGLFENPLADFSLVNELGSQAHRDLAREAVRKSLVLLKNGDNKTNPLLPLSKKAQKILVAGSHADNLGYQCGGWTIAWLGFSGNNYTRGTTILGAVTSTVDPGTEVVYRETPESDFVKSNNFEYAIVVVGEHPYAETLGDSMTLTMADPGPDLIQNVCEIVKCVVVIISGRPIVIEPYLSSINALVAAWLPGTEGQGITDVLFGDYGFSGKLPRTWFRTVDQLPMNVGDSHYDPLFPFGFGLTTESVKDLTRSTSAGVGEKPYLLTAIVSVVLSLLFAGMVICGYPEWIIHR
ncbi:Beta-glucosidase BoGH3B [Morella rubra]|uniref:Beta-glucosidase BoGH3B n=1 Tax=Morella rubra TaxID=262757 RepID=A0A6A1WNZ2_9ROSI|nr:Beta-glucosidase BoGH3B [Morella rubra]